MKNPYEKIDLAYRRGKLASKKGISVSENPYQKTKVGNSLSEYNHWHRGWLTGKR